MQLMKRNWEDPEAIVRWRRARFTPVMPLGEGNRLVTGSEAHILRTKTVAEEGMVLLKNDGTLPLKKGQKIAVFGAAQADYMRGGTGAGIVRCAFEKTLLDGLQEMDAQGQINLFQPLSQFYYDDVLDQRKRASVDGYDVPQLATYTNAHRTDMYHFLGRAVEPELPEDLLKQAAAFTDTAIVTISRVSGEFYDRTEEEFHLSAGEKKMIETVEQNFAHVIVTLNSGGQIEAGWLESEKISSVLLMLTPGQMGGVAAAELLCGLVNPSGKLVYTYARDYCDYPSYGTFEEDLYYVNYTEDIYVGYRYFETIPGAAEKVVFPFGFGLSYTTFSRKVLSAGEKDGVITVCVEVTNTGKVPGKEVIQVYYGAPQGKLGKAAKSLAAFQKTKLLAPGESETLTLSFTVNSMASYDDTGLLQKSAYLLEQGDYPVYVGASVRDVEVAYTYHVAEPFRVTEQLSERCPCIALPKRMKSDGTYEALPYGVLKRPTYKKFAATTEKVRADFSGEAATSATAAGSGGKLADVADGKLSLEDFVAQLDADSIAKLLGGVPSTGIASTSGFGGQWAKWGIPAIMTSDAPAGVRATDKTGLKPTCFPAAATIASSWNPELSEMAAETIALEIKENNMYAWLGPALNIHRDPLCGRNFEYYSEDPLLSGKMAAGAVRGAQKQRISACPKHFAANNKELFRRDSDSRLTERALREIYLKGFEICIKESKPRTLMSSYNYINGIRAAEHPDLLTWILREEWGFDGVVMTDWNGHGRHAVEVMAGGDLKMPEGDPRMIINFLKDRTMGQGQAEEAVRNILKLILWYEGVEV